MTSEKTTDIVIRPLSSADATQWRALRLEALRIYPTAFASAYEEALEQDLSGPDSTARCPEYPVWCVREWRAFRQRGAARLAGDETATQGGAMGNVCRAVAATARSSVPQCCAP